jgi:preprotein translocase subunit SecG
MEILRIVLTVIFILIGIALTVVVLLQEGKSAGLSGSISGAAETYWGRNKGRSMEGALEKFTKFVAIGFLVLAVILNLNF